MGPMKRFSPLLAFGVLLACSAADAPLAPPPAPPPMESAATTSRLMSTEWRNLVFRQLLLGTISHRDQLRAAQRRSRQPLAC